MKLGLIGFPSVGKRTLFRLLTGKENEPENGKGEAQGLAGVRDERFEQLVKIYQPPPGNSSPDRAFAPAGPGKTAGA